MSRDSVKQFYAERAELAYAIEHIPLGKTVYNLERYAQLQDDITRLEIAYAGDLPLPSCRLCGSHERTLLPRQTVCGSCASFVEEDAIAGQQIIAPQPGRLST